MRITFYMPTLSGGGAERVVLTVASKFVQAGHEVRLIVDRAEGPLVGSIATGIELKALRGDSVLRAFPGLVRELSKGWEDVLVSSLPANNVSAFAAIRLSRAGARHVAWEHNNLSRSSVTLKEKAIRRLALATYHFVDAIIAVSEGVRKDLLAHSRIDPQRVHKIFNPNPFTTSSREDGVPHPWLVSDRPFKVIVSAGRLTSQKDFPSLMEAHANLGDETKLIILGEGEQLAELEGLSQRLGTAKNVHFAGFVPNPLQWFRFADLFALSTHYEGFGNVLIEAMSVGLPIVCTDCESGPAEILEGGRYGRLVPPGNPDALAAALREALSRPGEAADLIGRAHEFEMDHLWPSFEAVVTGKPSL